MNYNSRVGIPLYSDGDYVKSLYFDVDDEIPQPGDCFRVYGKLYEVQCRVFDDRGNLKEFQATRIE